MNKILSCFFRQSEKVKEATPVTNSELVSESKTFGLGDGLWSIELQDGYGNCIAEFVGSNGQCFGEEPDDLWAEVEEWKSDPKGGLAIHHWSPSVWRTPDGSELTKNQFLREVESGRLHGVVLSF